ncbi:MAG TPA: transaldolase family protein [Anaerolineales bacterium]|nr:transaldolase family protein [Anaerolineales bacterium]
MKPYFIRVTEQSPTMFWINNPTRTQADVAMQHGALGCTNNPSYTQKMLDHPEEGPYAHAILDEIIKEVEDDRKAAVLFQQRMVKPIADKFRPMWESSGGRHGYVSIQGDPFEDEDTGLIIKDSLENREIGPNICCKIPVTEFGIAAMQELIPHNTPLNSTEIFAVNQMVTICETYEKLAHKSGKWPMFYMSHIAGIYDDFFGNYVKQHDIQISPDVLWQAGLAVARKVYMLMVERGYHATFIAGGARGLHHFTEMVGGRVCCTINWEGTADKLIEQNPPVVYRLFNPVPQKVIDELMEKLPDFKRGYLDEGLSVEEFAEFGPVQLFRSSFMKSWQRVLDIVKERRTQLQKA